MPNAVAKKYYQAPVTRAELARAKAAEHEGMPAIMQRPGYVLMQETPNMLAARKAIGNRPIPDDFGMPSGTRIANYDTIIPDLVAAMGRKEEPAVIFLLPKGQTAWSHAAAIYRHNGQLLCVNPVGRRKQEINNFMEGIEYLYGVRELDHHDEQYKLTPRPDDEGGQWKNPEGGVYHRNFDTAWLWKISPEQLEAMHAEYLGINQEQRDKQTRFRVTASKVLDWLDRMRGKDVRESINCAKAISRGFAAAGLCRETRYPKKIFELLIKGIGRKDPDNFDIISFGWVRHARRAHLSGGSSVPLPGTTKLGHYQHNSLIWSSPIPNLNTRFWNLASRAAAYVWVDGEIARIVRGPREYSRL